MELAEDSIRSIVAHYAHMRAEYGEVLEDAELVEPTSKFFPDEFRLDPESVDALLRRMLTYAPLSADLAVQLGFQEAEGEGGGGCGSGACAPGEKGVMQVARGGVIETADGYGVIVPVADAGEPKLLTACLARNVGRLVLHEADETVDTRDEAALSELTAVATGLGLILFNGACVYKKGCGGMRRHQGTSLDASELAFALALFVRVAEKSAGTVKKHLEPTQSELFGEALAWVDAQPKLVKQLREMPETLTDGVFTLEGKKGFLSRLFAGKDEGVTDAAVAKARAKSEGRSEEERRRIEETKRLVEEALQES